MGLRNDVADRGVTLRLEGVGVTPEGRRRPLFAGVDLELGGGDIVVVRGDSGVGKTTLIKAICGLVPWFDPGRVDGDIRLDGESLIDLDPGQRAHLLATGLDRPEAQLLLPRVEDEVAAASVRYRTPGPVREHILENLGVAPLLDRRPAELSTGERQRVVLAAALTAVGRPVLLDEPTVHLDEDAVRGVAGVLAWLGRRGTSALLTEHSGWRWDSANARAVRLETEGLAPTSFPQPPRFGPPSHGPGDRVVLEATGLVIGRGGRRVAGPLDLVLRQGEIVVLTGANGAGKSTLARTLTGWLRPVAGQLVRTGVNPRLMLPESELQLFAPTVEGELAGRGLATGEVARVLRRHRLEHLAARTPWTLSRGEQQRLVHASWDVVRPDVMVVDEPAQGLGPADLGVLVELIHRRAERGRAYLVITHRRELAAAAHRHLELDRGALGEVTT